MSLWPLSFRLDFAFQGWWMAILVLESQVLKYQMFQKIEPQKLGLFFFKYAQFFKLNWLPSTYYQNMFLTEIFQT